MKFISWNVNGLRACLGKGFSEFFQQSDADFFCVQETKMQPHQAELDFPGYEQYWNSAVKKGYSGTAVFTRHTPLSVRLGMNKEEHDQEGRLLTLEYPDFFLVNVYTPNSQRELARLDYRMQWEDDFRRYLASLDAEKAVILCGDINVAHQEIDIKNPKSNRRNAGFTDEERGKMSELLMEGFTDTFRYLYPARENAYTWWSYMMKARERNIGWRIDHVLVTPALAEKTKDCFVDREPRGWEKPSDHTPLVADFDL